MKTPNSKSNYFFGFKSFSLVQKNQPLIGDTNKLSVKKQTKKNPKQTNAFSIAAYHFSTLHTKTLPNKLKNVMKELIIFWG